MTEEARDTGVMPQTLADRPNLPLKLVYAWRAFHALTGDRQVGFNIGPIPFAAVDAYGRRHALAGDAFDRFHGLIQAMDKVYLRHLAEKEDDENG